jgi:pyruvate dehydrogenase E1 component beta subunit
MALAGLTPVVNVISSDFLFRTMDAICNTAAKLASVGEARTIVVQAEFMTGGPTSGQRVESMFVGVPGLSVCCPSNPRDAFGCMLGALEHRGVTLMFEDRMIEDATTDEVDVPFYDGTSFRVGRAAQVQGGEEGVVVVSYGLALRLLEGWLDDEPYELIDLRWLYPVDFAKIEQAVRRKGALLVVEPDSVYAGVGAEIVARIAEHCPGVRVARLGAPRVTIPTAREHHDRLLPTREAVLAKCAELSR